jgi:hypothetical protein
VVKHSAGDAKSNPRCCQFRVLLAGSHSNVILEITLVYTLSQADRSDGITPMFCCEAM